jgi:hypothetical protein
MLAQIDLLSLVLSPVLFYLGGSALFMLLSYLKLIKTEA